MNKGQSYSDLKKSEDAKRERAKEADLITLPEKVEGTNCGNCKFVQKTKDGGYCKHEKVRQEVTPRMCCIYWDAPGVKREWK